MNDGTRPARVRRSGPCVACGRTARFEARQLCNSCYRVRRDEFPRERRETSEVLDLGDHAGIVLNTGEVALIDWPDVHLATGVCWFVNKGYATHKLRGTLHRIVAGVGPDTDVDHINGCRLDNRRGNLRPASRAQNMANKPKSNIAASSSFKGVHWHSQRNRWTAQYRHRHLGLFGTEEAAALAYDAAARADAGPFARFNFPLDGERSAVA